MSEYMRWVLNIPYYFLDIITLHSLADKPKTNNFIFPGRTIFFMIYWILRRFNLLSLADDLLEGINIS